MRTPPKNWTPRLLQALLILALFCIILNPELRVLILFVDAIGLEIAFILVALQAQALSAMIAPTIQRLTVTLCKVASQIGYLALAAYQSKVNSRALHLLLGPILIGLSYGVRCNAVWRG